MPPANLVRNDTPLALVFGQVGTREAVPLHGYAQAGYAWQLPPSELSPAPHVASGDVRSPGPVPAEDPQRWASAGFGGDTPFLGMGTPASAHGMAVGSAGGDGVRGTQADVVDEVRRELRFRLAETGDMAAAEPATGAWSGSISLGASRDQWVQLRLADGEWLLLLASVEVSGFTTCLTLSPSHTLFNQLSTPLSVTLLHDGVPFLTESVPAHSGPHPLLLRFPHDQPRSHSICVHPPPSAGGGTGTGGGPSGGIGGGIGGASALSAPPAAEAAATAAIELSLPPPPLPPGCADGMAEGMARLPGVIIGGVDSWQVGGASTRLQPPPRHNCPQPSPADWPRGPIARRAHFVPSAVCYPLPCSMCIRRVCPH